VSAEYVSADGEMIIILEASPAVDENPCFKSFYYLYATATLYMASCSSCPVNADSAGNDFSYCTCRKGYMGSHIGPCRTSMYSVHFAVKLPMMETAFDTEKQEILRAATASVAGQGTSSADVTLWMQTISTSLLRIQDVNTRVDIQLKAENQTSAAAAAEALTEANINSALAAAGMTTATLVQLPSFKLTFPEQVQKGTRSCPCDLEVTKAAAIRGSAPICFCAAF
jgi:hypothetical protein